MWKEQLERKKFLFVLPRSAGSVDRCRMREKEMVLGSYPDMRFHQILRPVIHSWVFWTSDSLVSLFSLHRNQSAVRIMQWAQVQDLLLETSWQSSLVKRYAAWATHLMKDKSVKAKAFPRVLLEALILKSVYPVSARVEVAISLG